MTNNKYDDVGLSALNGYYEELMQLNCEIDAIKSKNKITEKYPEMEDWEFEIIEM